MDDAIVFIPGEDVFGKVINQSAYFSVVSYEKDGIVYEIALPNEDLIFVISYKEEE
jgi:hypothetical protein